ncbi:hypothetical protein L204_102685 [Cryptococcus depauperatus]
MRDLGVPEMADGHENSSSDSDKTTVDVDGFKAVVALDDTIHSTTGRLTRKTFPKVVATMRLHIGPSNVDDNIHVNVVNDFQGHHTNTFDPMLPHRLHHLGHQHHDSPFAPRFDDGFSIIPV